MLIVVVPTKQSSLQIILANQRLERERLEQKFSLINLLMTLDISSVFSLLIISAAAIQSTEAKFTALHGFYTENYSKESENNFKRNEANEFFLLKVNLLKFISNFMIQKVIRLGLLK